MNKLFIIAFILLSTDCSYGQYRLNGPIYRDTLPLSKTKSLYKVFSLHKCGDMIRVFRFFDSSKYFTVKSVSLNGKLLTEQDTIHLTEPNFPLSDIVCTADYDLMIGYERLNLYDKKSRVTRYLHSPTKEGDTLDFSHGALLDDTTLVLYQIYNFHPFDGFAGFNAGIYNLKSSKIIKQVKIRTQGIALGHMTINWVTALQGSIYQVTPLSGMINKYDRSLKLIGTEKLPIPWTDYAKNVAFERKTDLEVYNEWDRLYNIRANHLTGPNDTTESFLYGKDYLYNTSQAVRAEHDFIEKLIPYNDSLFIITVSRAGYGFDYRDLYFYLPSKNEIIKEYTKWRCKRGDTAGKAEEYFPVDVINDAPGALIFIDNTIYFGTFYDPASFCPGSKDEVDKIMMKEIYKNDYRWKLLEYTLER